MKTIKLAFVFATWVAALSGCQQPASDIDLSGQWSFKIDSLDVGVTQQWFTKVASDTIHLPGSMTENGKGDDVTVHTKWTGSMWDDSVWYKSPKMEQYRKAGSIKLPFWLTPDKVYVGAAWYQKRITLPESWKGKDISLHLERAHWETTVWLDDKLIGTENSLGTPHDYDFGNDVLPGDHTLSIRIDNRVKDVEVGMDAHSISDNTQTNWNGIVGSILLRSTPAVAIDDVQLYPDVKGKKINVKVKIKNATGKKQQCKLELHVTGITDNASFKKIESEVAVDVNGQVDIEYSMGDAPLLWDEFNPNLYTLNVRLKSDEGVDEEDKTFGMRAFKADGRHLLINDRRVFLRGTLECAIFPLTGYPPTDVAAWKRIFNIIKDHGLNHMRFHSWCPPEAAFQAADELGVYLQIEASAWATVGNGAAIDKWVLKEAEDITDTYGNHPSFVMMTYGNEPAGKNQKAYLSNFVDHMKKHDSRRLFSGGTGWPYLDNADYYVSPQPRIQHWGDGVNSIINGQAPQTMFDYNDEIAKTPIPYIGHEIGQWCVYPNFKEIKKYTGVLKARNFEIFKASLDKNHLGHLADSFLLASGKLQVLCYKADIEAALRTKDFAGFQLLDLHDFPGQGTALVGVLDAFWDEKGYVSPEEYRAFCSETVPLARLAKRIFSNTDTLKAAIEIAHFGEKQLISIVPKWTVVDTKGKKFAEGTFAQQDVLLGNGIHLGDVSLPLQTIQQPQKLTLKITVGKKTNQWDVWVYPVKKDAIEDKNIRVSQKLDEATVAYLEKGGNVLLNITKGDVAPQSGGAIGVGFSSIFWNTSWTKGQQPHTLGILCDPTHPALNEFPTEYHSNWQWWDAMSNSNAIVLDEFTPKLKPIVYIIDDWFQNRRTALIFEAKVGKGKLLVCGVDLHTNLNQRLEAQQLLYSLKKYVAGDHFNPAVSLESGALTKLFSYK